MFPTRAPPRVSRDRAAARGCPGPAWCRHLQERNFPARSGPTSHPPFLSPCLPPPPPAAGVSPPEDTVPPHPPASRGRPAEAAMPGRDTHSAAVRRAGRWSREKRAAGPFPSPGRAEGRAGLPPAERWLPQPPAPGAGRRGRRRRLCPGSVRLPGCCRCRLWSLAGSCRRRQALPALTSARQPPIHSNHGGEEEEEGEGEGRRRWEGGGEEEDGRKAAVAAGAGGWQAPPSRKRSLSASPLNYPPRMGLLWGGGRRTPLSPPRAPLPPSPPGPPSLTWPPHRAPHSSPGPGKRFSGGTAGPAPPIARQPSPLLAVPPIP